MTDPTEDPFSVLQQTRPPATKYEFDAEQNAVIEQSVRAMRRAAALVLLAPVARLIAGLRVARLLNVDGTPRGGQGAALINFAIGLSVALVSAGLLWQTTRALRDVISTEGDDVAHMMRALRAQSRYFWLQLGLLVFAVLASLAVAFLSARSPA